MSSVIAPPYLNPAERFDRIMQAVCEAIAAQHKEGRLFGPLLILAWPRLRQAGVKVLAVAAAYAAGRLPWCPRPLRPYRPRPKAPPEAAPAATATPPAPERLKLPTGFGWLLGRARVGFGREHLMLLLADPEMRDLIAVAPQIAHHLRPICRMLGVKPPPGLLPERRKPRRPPRETPPATPASPPKAAKTARPPSPLSGTGETADPRPLRTPAAAPAHALVQPAQTLPLQTGLTRAVGQLRPFCSIYGT